MLGEGSNAVVWPQSPSEDEEEEADEVESYNNQRLMRIGKPNSHHSLRTMLRAPQETPRQISTSPMQAPSQKTSQTPRTTTTLPPS